MNIRLMLVFCLMFLSEIVSGQVIPSYSVSIYSQVSGYFFLTPLKIGPNPNGITPSMMIIDGDGEVAYIKNLNINQVCGDFKIQNNGLMSFYMQDKFYMMDSTFTIIDSVSCGNGIETDLHDMKILPNGNFLMLGIEELVMDLSSFHLFGPNNVPGGIQAVVECGIVQELDINKNVVFEWHATNHFAFDDIDEAWLPDPNMVDWTHCNAVEQDTDGNILLSSRHFNEITKIDRQNGSIIWRFGGNANQFNFLNDPLNFRRQHDVRRISNGNLTVFDNGDGNYLSPFHYASAKEYQLNVSAMTADLVWNYTDDVNDYSLAMGSFQHQPGGNAVISYGINANQNKTFNVVNNSGQKILDFTFLDSLVTYRVQYYPSFPWAFNRPVISCYENSGQYYLDAGPGYASYNWSNGATTQVIPLTSIGDYYLYVPAGGPSAYFRSSTFHVYNMADPCGLSGIAETQASVINIFPNPVQDVLNLKLTKIINNSEPVMLFDITGKQLTSILPDQNGECKISLNEFPSGVYWIRYGVAASKVIRY